MSQQRDTLFLLAETLFPGASLAQVIAKSRRIPVADERRRMIAYHEAGHAVAASVLDGCFCHYVESVAGPDRGGYTFFRAPPDPLGLEQTTIALAGIAAEAKVGCNRLANWSLAGAMGDIDDIMGHWIYDVDRDAWREELTEMAASAQELVAANWVAIDRLAAALQRRDRIERAEVEDIVFGVSRHRSGVTDALRSGW